MAGCSIHENPNPRTRAAVPFLLDVQSEALSVLGSRLVVPLYRQEATGGAPITRLCPVVSFQGQALVALVEASASVRSYQ